MGLVTAAAGLFCVSMIWIPSNPVDLVLGSLYLGTGAAFIALAWGGADSLGRVRLTDAVKTHAALFICGGAMVASAIYNAIIGADFGFYGGVHAGLMVTIFNVAITPLLAYAAAVAGPSVVPESAGTPAEVEKEGYLAPDANDQQVFTVFDALMRERKLFKDPDLTLNRLARRAGVPARTLSTAVNRVVGRNISQVVNEYRIAEAQAMLRETSLPVTSVMDAVGFRTKSNFNREFLRVTGTSPSAFRQATEAEKTVATPASTS